MKEMLLHYNIQENYNVNGKAISIVNKDGQHIFFIGLFNSDYSTLVHESTHIAFFIYEAIGQKLSYHDEIFCYLTAEIFDKCRKKWIKLS